MNIHEAIKLLDSATALLSLNRADHVKIQQALTVISSYVQGTEEVPEGKKSAKK